MTALTLPPGPRAGRLAQTLAVHRDPIGVLRHAQASYGDVFTIRLGTAGPTVVLASAEAAERLPGSDPAASCAGAARRSVLPMASPLSVFGGDGDEHAAARRRIEDLFADDGWADELRPIAARHVAGWPSGRPFRLLPRMRRLADEVFVRLVLRARRVDELRDAIGRLLWTPGNPPMTVAGPGDGLVGRAVDAGYRRRRARVAALLGDELEERRGGAEPGPGVLGRLVADEPQRPTEAMVEELLSLLMAAQEPMASALTWLGRVGAATPGEIEEGLRLHPPAFGSLRVLREPLDIGGHHLPAGTPTMVPIPLVQRDPRWCDAPDAFRPERALAGPHLPFGGGGRSCIAEPFARAQLATVLPLLADAGVRAVGGEERAVLRATILVPQRSGLVARG